MGRGALRNALMGPDSHPPPSPSPVRPQSDMAAERVIKKEDGEKLAKVSPEERRLRALRRGGEEP